MQSGCEGDALPGRIPVCEATREWSLRVDEKLAHRLQEEEINKHLDGNRHRNEILRQSYPVAASMQQMVVDEANRKAHLIQQRIDVDAKIAKEQQKLELQKAGVKTKRSISHQPASVPLPEEIEAGPSTSHSAHMSNGAIPKRPPVHRSARSYSADAEYDRHGRGDSFHEDTNANLAELEAALGVSKEQLNLEKERLLQEEKDAELARQLLNTDIRDPVEIADGELARRLQDREYERYQKSKEKRALRKQMEKMNSSRAQYQQETNHKPELSDMYSQPHDTIQGPSLPPDNALPKLPDIPSPPLPYNHQNNGHPNVDPNQQEDPYYMEPIHTSDPAFLNGLNIHNNNDYKDGRNNNLGTDSSTNSSINGNRHYNVMTNSSQGSMGSHTEHKRAPPAPPKSLGRPRMAEPEPHTGSLRSSNSDDKDRSKARCRQM